MQIPETNDDPSADASEENNFVPNPNEATENSVVTDSTQINNKIN